MLEVEKMKVVIVETDETIATEGGNLLVGELIAKTNLSKGMESFLPNLQLTDDDIQTGDVVISYLGTLSQSQTDFEAIEQFRDNSYFKKTLEVEKVPSSSTLRQRLNALGKQSKEEVIEFITEEGCNLLRTVGVEISPCFDVYIPLDIDVSAFDNSNTKKEGVSWTYKHFMGYAPIFAYLGEEGYCVNAELREGSQHCQKNTPEFLEETIKKARLVTDKPILVRLDSGNDASVNMALMQKHPNVDFLIKRNPRQESIEKHFNQAVEKGVEIEGTREGKQIFVYEHEKLPQDCKESVRIISFVTKRTITAKGQGLLMPEYELESYYTSLPAEKASSLQVQKLYHNHGTSEQFHSELKTDLDLERLPSGKFATNAIVLALGLFAYNLLRIIGQESLRVNDYPPTRHKVKRRRVRTVIDRYIFLGVKLTRSGRINYVKLNKSNPWLESFKRIYKSFRNLNQTNKTQKFSTG